MNAPYICVDSVGGPYWTWVIVAKVARDVLGENTVFSMTMRGTDMIWLDKLIKWVEDTTRQVLTFSTIPRIVLFLDAIERVSLKNDLTQKDRDLIHKWPTCVKTDFTGRLVEVCTLDACKPKFLEKFSDAHWMFFAKTLIKKSSWHGTLMSQWDITCARENRLLVVASSHERSFVEVQDNEPLIISQPFEIAEDEQWKIEYRSWIINHKLSCVSRYWKENRAIDPQSDLLDFIERFTSAHKDILPKHYVLDFARTKSGELYVVELNFLWESGIAGDLDIRSNVLKCIFTSLKQRMS
jgi:hypothetical protein